MKGAKYYIISIALVIVTAVTFGVLADETTDTQVKEFLSSYGWKVKPECIEQEAVIIPKPFDLVYENYNILQKEAGLDLSPYMGKYGVRYTYEVSNYPFDPGELVRANVIIVDGNCVGGDICTVSLHGFIHSLQYSPE